MYHLLAILVLSSGFVLSALQAATATEFTPPPTVPIPAGTFMQGDLTAGKDVAWHTDADADGAGDGGGSWRSGRIGKDQQVDLTWTGTTGSQVGFWFRTDVDGSPSSLDNSNVLEFLVDGTVVATWTGSSDWTRSTHDLPTGEHTLTWRYRKNRPYHDSNDSVWVDGITVDGGTALEAAALSSPSVTSVGVGYLWDHTARRATLTRGYHMSIYEISVVQYVAMLEWALDPDGDGDQSDGLLEARYGDGHLIGARMVDADPVTGRRWDAHWVADVAVDERLHGHFQLVDDDGRFGIRDVPGHPDGDVDSRAHHPKVRMTWYDAMFYCFALNRRLGIDGPIDLKDWSVDLSKPGWRPPTEAEWERAARAGGDPLYAWGDDVGGDQANIIGNDIGHDGIPRTVRVDTFAPNGYGLYNMSGNAAEWCLDGFNRKKGSGEAVTDPLVREEGDFGRVYRGGSRDFLPEVQIARRAGATVLNRFTSIGFRPVLISDEDAQRHVTITVQPRPSDLIIEHRSAPFLEGTPAGTGRLFAPLQALVPHSFGFTRSVNQ